MSLRTNLVALCGLASLFLGSIGSAQDCRVKQSLTPADLEQNDRFGEALAIDGDVLVIGAPLDDEVTVQSGSLIVFRKVQEEWIEEQKIFPQDATYLFGRSVDVDGDVLVAGAFSFDDQSTGAAYVYRFDGSTWQFETRLQSIDSAPYDTFGEAVALWNSWIFVGAPRMVTAGSVYVFGYEGGQWLETQELVAPDGITQQFGKSLDADGNRLLVGAPNHTNWHSDHGAAYVFDLSGQSWTERQRIVASDGSTGDLFGASVALFGQQLIVGSPRADAQCPQDPECNSGAAYVFVEHSGVFTEHSRLVGSLTESQDEFGFSVALNADHALVGVPSADHDGIVNSGEAWAFMLDANQWVESRRLDPTNRQGAREFGWSVALDEDALIGAPGRFGGRTLVLPLDLPFPQVDSYGDGWPGTQGVPDLAITGLPEPGSLLTLILGNSLGATTSGTLVIGTNAIDLETQLGGHLLVAPDFLLALSLPAEGLSLPAYLPNDCSFLGLSIYLQLLVIDAGASNGVAFSRGLALLIGEGDA